ncbi:MAG TPA: SRPBCC family protein [Flavisolibacter sp.]|nr:SRPBCC family protein [Flavisolibacter sp.]
MLVYKIVTTISAPAPVVFEYLTKASNFPDWLKDVFVVGRAPKEIRAGSMTNMTIRVWSPRKFTMRVTGYVKDRYFRIEASKGFAILPGYSFSLKPVKGKATQLTTYLLLSLSSGDEKDMHKLPNFMYPLGIKLFWEFYISLLEKEIMKIVNSQADDNLVSNKNSKKRVA